MFEPSMQGPGNTGRPKGSLRVLETPSCMRDSQSSKYNNNTPLSPTPGDHQQKGPPPFVPGPARGFLLLKWSFAHLGHMFFVCHEI